MEAGGFESVALWGLCGALAGLIAGTVLARAGIFAALAQWAVRP